MPNFEEIRNPVDDIKIYVNKLIENSRKSGNKLTKEIVDILHDILNNADVIKDKINKLKNIANNSADEDYFKTVMSIALKLEYYSDHMDNQAITQNKHHTKNRNGKADTGNDIQTTLDLNSYRAIYRIR